MLLIFLSCSFSSRLQVERDEHEEKLENVAEFLKKVTLKWKEHKDKIGVLEKTLMFISLSIIASLKFPPFSAS